MSKIITARQAAEMVKDDMTLAIGGFVGLSVPEELIIGLRDRYMETQSPRNLFLFHVSGVGDNKSRGGSHLGLEGLVRKIYCAHIGLEPALNRLTRENKAAAFLVPQGVITHLMRAIAGKKVGVVTHVGLKTYADPRLEGCKINDAARSSGEEVVELITLGGKEQLFYKAFPLDICFIKATYADTDGNLSLIKEPAHTDQFEMAAAVHNSGGIVIAQVEKIVERNTLHPQEVKIHGFMVDYIVEAAPQNHLQCLVWPEYRPECSGETRVPVSSIAPAPLNERKVIGRRAAFELEPGMLVNLGIGLPDVIAAVASEEGILDGITLSIESGILGGVPTPGLGIGGSVNPAAMYKHADIFDIYDGGGINLSCLGAAQIDSKGNVNVSLFGGKPTGPGGFVNISQNTKKVCFCGTFTAGKASYDIGDGALSIREDGPGIKFVRQVEQVTFSGEYASENGQPILYITERAVFELTPQGLMLTEIAPGVDLEKDILAKMEFAPLISPHLKRMDARIFTDQPMGLNIDRQIPARSIIEPETAVRGEQAPLPSEDPPRPANAAA